MVFVFVDVVWLIGFTDQVDILSTAILLSTENSVFFFFSEFSIPLKLIWSDVIRLFQ